MAAPDSPDETVRVAVLGTGIMGSRWSGRSRTWTWPLRPLASPRCGCGGRPDPGDAETSRDAGRDSAGVLASRSGCGWPGEGWAQCPVMSGQSDGTWAESLV
jgi:hypothetical protein